MTFFNNFRHNSTKIACALVALVLLSATARAQTQDEPDVVTTSTNLVILNVGVATPTLRMTRFVCIVTTGSSCVCARAAADEGGEGRGAGDFGEGDC